MPKKNENKTDSIQMLQEESDRIRQLVIKTQTESMILDLKKSVLCFGLYLPPEELLCRNFSVLSMDDVVDCLSLLQDVKSLVDNPNVLIDRMKIECHVDDLDVTFKQPKDVWDHVPLFSSQTLAFLKMKDLPDHSEIMSYYRSYLEKLVVQLKPIVEKSPSGRKNLVVMGDGFSVRSKIPITIDPRALPCVYVYLVKEGCLEDGQKTEFLSIFDNILFAKTDCKIRWLSINVKNGYPNWERLRVLFQELGVDMDKTPNYEFIARFFIGVNNKTPDLKPRGHELTDDLKRYISGLRTILNNQSYEL